MVSPELAFTFASGESAEARDKWLDKFRTLARDNDVFLAFGYLDICDNANRLAFMGPNGEVLGIYTKTHLTPSEGTETGDGTPVVTDILGHRVGGMICHDDNYTSLTRAYGRRETALLVSFRRCVWFAVSLGT